MKTLGILIFLLFSFEASALTPQKYCESLAATSCEILNVEPGSGTAGIIKYCRDRKFQITPLIVTSNGTNTSFYVFDSLGGNMRSIQNGQSPGPSAWSSTTLCSYLS